MINNKKKHPSVSGPFFEQIREGGSSTTKPSKKDLVGKVTETAVGIAEGTLTQLLGIPKTGELKEGQVLEFSKEKKRKELLSPYFEIHRKEALLFVREQEITQEVEAARAELKQAIKELEKLGQDVAAVEKTVEKMPVKPGIYHLSFFERLRQIIRFFRERIEESRTWLGMMASKKRQKRYWALYKKHGTKFGLSAERVIATQAG